MLVIRKKKHYEKKLSRFTSHNMKESGGTQSSFFTWMASFEKKFFYFATLCRLQDFTMKFRCTQTILALRTPSAANSK